MEALHTELRNNAVPMLLMLKRLRTLLIESKLLLVLLLLLLLLLLRAGVGDFCALIFFLVLTLAPP